MPGSTCYPHIRGRFGHFGVQYDLCDHRREEQGAPNLQIGSYPTQGRRRARPIPGGWQAAELFWRRRWPRRAPAHQGRGGYSRGRCEARLGGPQAAGNNSAAISLCLQILQVVTSPSAAAVVRPVRMRHRSTASWRAMATAAFLRAGLLPAAITGAHFFTGP